MARSGRRREAEAVAYVVGEAIGLDVAQAARDYLQLYRGNREASLDRIQRAAATILSRIGLGG